MPLIMRNNGVRGKDVLPPGTGEPITEVNVFEVHEVALVEATDCVKSLPAHEQTGAGKPACFSASTEILPCLIRLGERVAWPKRVEHGVADAGDQGGYFAGGGVRGTVCLLNAWSHCPGARIGVRAFNEAVDGTGHEFHVRVDHEDVVGVDLTGSALLRQRLCRRVDRRTVANVATSGQVHHVVLLLG